MPSTARRSLFTPARLALAVLFLAGLTPTETWATCCNIVTTQSCADCNFFMCACKHSCDCKNSCETNCSQDQNTCLIYCTQGNCMYCNDYYYACVKRCTSAASSEAKAEEPLADAVPACQQIYQAIDRDRTGGISKAEFVDFITTQRKAPWPASGVLSPVQAAVGSVAGQDPAAVFGRLDINGDGTIDKAEAGLQ